MDFNYDYNKLRSFINDLVFILQTGGSGSILEGGGIGSTTSSGLLWFLKVIVFTITAITTLIVLFVIIRFAYKLITKGYPVLLHNLFTFSFYRKENLNNILEENDLLFTSFDNLYSMTTIDCNNPYIIFDYIYKNHLQKVYANTESLNKTFSNYIERNSIFQNLKTSSVKDNISDNIVKAKQYMDEYYTQLEYNYDPQTLRTTIYNKYIREKYYYFFSEYYLFYKNLLQYKTNKKNINENEHKDYKQNNYLNTYVYEHSTDGMITTPLATISDGNSTIYEIRYDIGIIHFDDKIPGVENTFYIVGNAFYDNFTTKYLRHRGLINTKNMKGPGELSDTELKFNMLKFENNKRKKGKATFLQERLDVYNTLNSIRMMLEMSLKVIETLPFHQYIFTPANQNIVNEVINNVNQYSSIIKEGTILASQFQSPKINAYSWFIIEVFTYERYLSNDNTPNTIWKMITSKFVIKDSYGNVQKPSKYLLNLLLIYMNTSLEKRDDIKTKLLKDISTETVDIIDKFPIAARIYYNGYLNKLSNNNTLFSSEVEMYTGTMTLYRTFMSERLCTNKTRIKIQTMNCKLLLENLIKHTMVYKRFITSIYNLDLYLNKYHSQLVSMFDLQYNIGKKDFFKYLTNSYIDDYFKYKIKTYWKRIDFGNKNYRERQLIPKFNTTWDKIGKTLKNLLNNIWGTFKHDNKDTPKEPEAVPNEEMYSKSDIQNSEKESANDAEPLPGDEDLNSQMQEAQTDKQEQEKRDAELRKKDEEQASLKAKSEQMQKKQEEEQRKREEQMSAMNKPEEQNE